ncbi:DUF4176 domain-containing protein [Bacillus lacus]|uniref:DUF4176 domain-containing protein n=1 Tax=Metabacillus lacus TaxID=1983721 RepID=A0A7X2J3D6_9BACI|nr:DUF4176 domain-containing protein [Metabacillus lacus]MRX73993.1 DUF4176 domain-containing protein [Metabacillus lacus]
MLLPIGSIVYLKEGTSKLMIMNRGPILEEGGEHTMFDYSACFYPQGLVHDKIFYFNHENIDEVVFEGFQDQEEERFQKLFHDWKQDNGDRYSKGKVDGPLE